jgi:hypothetical protein
MSDEKTKARHQEFMFERSHRASDTAYDVAKTTAQSCLLINGGAATAVVALLSKDTLPVSLLKTIPSSLALYVLGVAAAAVMLFCVMRMADQWNYFWYWMSHGDEPEARKAEAIAKWWHKFVYVAFTISILFFLIASALLACTLAGSK